MLRRTDIGLGCLLVLVALVCGCGGGGGSKGSATEESTFHLGGPANEPPTVEILGPASGAVVSRGGTIEIVYRITDTEDTPKANVFLDADGDVQTTKDRIYLAWGWKAPNGQPTSMTWDTTGAPAGEYTLVVMGDDQKNKPVFCPEDCKVTVKNVAWASSIGLGISGPGSGVIGSDLACLDDGSTFSTGMIQGSVVFGAGTQDETIVSSTGQGEPDVFLARHDPDGRLVWVATAGGQRMDEGRCVAALADGSALVAGSFFLSAVFGAGEANETVLTCSLCGDGFLARYSPDGTLDWAKRLGGTPEDIAVWPDGSFVITGSCSAGAVFGPGEPGETTFTGFGSSDAFVARYSPDGSLLWVRGAGSQASSEGGTGVAALPDGGCVVTGAYGGTATFGLGETGESILSAGSSKNMFVARYRADGSLVWAHGEGGGGEVTAEAIDVFSDGTFVVVGTYRDPTTFGSGFPTEVTLPSSQGEPHGFWAWFGQDGAMYVVRTQPSSHGDFCKDVTVLADDSFVVTGSSFGMIVLGSSVVLGDALPENYLYAARYLRYGWCSWAARAIGVETWDFPPLVAAQPDGSFAVLGTHFDPMLFGAGEPHETRLAGNGTVAAFLARYNADGGF